MSNKQKISNNLEDLFIGENQETVFLVKKIYSLIKNSDNELKIEVHYAGKEPYFLLYITDRKQTIYSVQVCTDHIKLYFHNLSGKDLLSFSELTGNGKSMRHIKIIKGKTLNEKMIIKMINYFKGTLNNLR